jgi:hypothetical protein
MGHSVWPSLLFTGGVVLGFLLMPTVPELGGVVIIVACGIVLIAWLHGSPR